MQSFEGISLEDLVKKSREQFTQEEEFRIIKQLNGIRINIRNWTSLILAAAKEMVVFRGANTKPSSQPSKKLFRVDVTPTFLVRFKSGPRNKDSKIKDLEGE